MHLRPRDLYTGQLLNPDTTSPYYQREPGRYRSELHERFANVLYPLAFALLATAGVGQAQSTRQNRNLQMALCFLAGVGIRLGGLAANNVVSLHAAAVPLLYAIPIAAIIWSLIAIKRGARPSRLSPWLERGMAALSDRIASLRQRIRPRPAASGAAGLGS